MRPPLGGVWQRESDGGQVLAGGVAVDAVAPCIGLDGDGGAGGDPGRADSRRACPRIRCRRDCLLEGYAQRGNPLASTTSGARGSTPGSAATTADEREFSAEVGP